MDMDQDTSNAPGWRPEEGDTIIGHILAIEAGWSDYQQANYPIVVIADEGKEDNAPTAVHAFHTVLLKRLLTLRPRVGERIGIKHNGETDSKDGKRKIVLYTVRIEGREAEASWDSFGSAQPQATAVDSRDFQPQGSTVPLDDDIPF